MYMHSLSCGNLLKGAIIYEQGARMFNWENPIFLSIINGLVGATIGIVVTSFISFRVIKVEKKYYIELEVLTDKILNPLLRKHNEIKKRQNLNTKELVSSTIFNEIDNIFDSNICWCFITNKKIKTSLINIRDYSKNRDSDNLINELTNLYNKIEDIYVKKYK